MFFRSLAPLLLPSSSAPSLAAASAGGEGVSALPLSPSTAPLPRSGDVAEGERATARRLAVLSDLPEDQNGVTLSIGDIEGVAKSEVIELVAGVNYSSIAISVADAGSSFSPDLDGIAALRLVLETARAEFGNCDSASYVRSGGLGFVDSTLALTVDGTGNLRTTGSTLSFMAGGYFAFCFSKDGTFAAGGESAELLLAPRAVELRGAGTACAGDRCLADLAFQCFVYRSAAAPETSCVVHFDTLSFVEDRSAVLLSWGPTLTGESAEWGCDGRAPSARMVGTYSEHISGSVGREFALRAKEAAGAEGGFALQACFCPAYDDDDNGTALCDSVSEFVQPVGQVYFYFTKICNDIYCGKEYSIVVHSSPFVVNMDCAGVSACAAATGNRLRVIDDNGLGLNDLPSWLPQTGCRVASVSDAYWGPDGGLDGGSRDEYKAFEDVSLAPYYVSGVAMSRSYDFCYCDTDCDAVDSSDRFHKVGRVEISPLRLLRYRESGGESGLRMVGVFGDIMVYGRTNIPVTPLQAQIKVLWDEPRDKTSTDCAGLEDLVEFALEAGPSCVNRNNCGFKASYLETDPPDVLLESSGEIVYFNDGGTQGERFRFERVGVIAICYCGVLADGSGSQLAGECLEQGGRSHWTLLSRTMVRGPCLVQRFSGECQEQTWEFFTGIPFRLELLGLGLHGTDKIRIIPANDMCRGNPDGGGEPTVFKGCPAACNPLTLTDTYLYGGGSGKDDIDIHVTTSETVACNPHREGCSTAKVVEVLPGNEDTVWRFDADPQLSDNDVIVLDNVTGGTDEENALMAGHVGLDPLGWPVTRTSDPRRFRVPVHPGMPDPPQFVPSGGWTRLNWATTKEEIKATAAKSSLQVCWGSGPDAYHTRAGRVVFKDPDPMPAAVISLTTLQRGRRAPAVIEFQTSAGGDTALKYKTTDGLLRLRLAFDDVAKLEPRLADADGSVMPDVAPGDRDGLEDARQFVCGGLFLEFWSDDDKGFPMPRGCYYTSLLDNRREVSVVFEPKSGFEAGTKYQLVMNLRVAPEASTLLRLLSVWSMDDVELRPYGVIELGDARLNRNPEAESGVGEPRFMSSGGFTLLDGFDGRWDLLELTTDPLSLLFRLKGDGQSPIEPGAMLRIFMWPLTVWDIEPVCQAQCFPHRTKTCGLISTCVGESVVQFGQRNIVRLQLPTEMTPIYGTTVQHTIRVSELSLPLRGFFGTRLAAQVSLPDESRMHYVESSGAFLWKQPRALDPQLTLAALVTTEGDGNPLPFRGDESNTLFARFALGASLRAELRDGDASLGLALPPGYHCRAVARAPEALEIFGEAIPQGRGGLQPSVGEVGGGGTWHLDGNLCEYRLKAGEIIPAGSRIFLELTVDNPEQPLQQSDVLNRWSLLLSSKGWYRWSTQTATGSPFVDSTAIGESLGSYSANVAVKGLLTHVNLQPTNFQAGFDANWLHVFFRPEQKSGYDGAVLLAAPVGFSFAVIIPDECQVSRLAGSYYRVARGEQTTHYLPIVTSCISDCTLLFECPDETFNRANIGIRNSLWPERLYGFRVKVINRDNYLEGDKLAWSLTTVDASRRGLDAARPSLPLNPAVAGTDLAWGVYGAQGNADNVGLAFSLLRPTTSRDAMALMTVFPLQLGSTFTATCRLTAPQGYELSPGEFVFHYAGIAGATASWPGQEPWQSQLTNPGRTNPYGDQAVNVLVWDEATYLSGERYGFASRIFIPRFPLATTTSALFVEFGWDATSIAERPLAYVLPMPQVRAIVNFTVGYQSNVAGLRYALNFAFETQTEVPIGGQVKVVAPTGFIFEERCSLLSILGEPPVPKAVNCEAKPDFTVEGIRDGTAIRLHVTTAPLPAGRTAFALMARNPPEPQTNRGGQQTSCGYEQCWTVEATDTSGTATDASDVARGFAVHRAMPEAKLVNLDYFQRLATGRNDRPGRPNDVIFAFMLSERAASVGEMIVSGPYGFSFDQDCLPGLRLDDDPVYHEDNVFGTLSWLPQFDRWEAAAKVQSCLGTGPVARIYIELGLRAGKRYAFRIHLTANPYVMASTNLWTIEYSGESSSPFQGFTLWTFSESSLTPRTTAQTSDTSMMPNPVTLRFRPHKEVQAGAAVGGLLRLVAPAGFEAIAAGSTRVTCAEYELIAEAAGGVGEGALFMPGEDVQCSIDQAAENTITFALIGSKKLEAGKAYTLIAQFYNPRSVSSVAEPWTAMTYNDPSGDLEAALDATTIPGFLVKPQVFRWEVTPPEGEQHAGTLAVDVRLEMTFPTTIGEDGGGEIHIRAPEGFDLAAPRNCEPYLGEARGGEVRRIGPTSSMQECADRVWAEYPQSDAAQWSSMTTVCYSYTSFTRLDICGPVPDDDNSSGRRLADCSAIYTQVCSFSNVDRACHGFKVQGNSQLTVVPTCAGNFMLFRFSGGDALPGLAAVDAVVTTLNPARNPGLVESFWSVEQYDSSMDLQYSGAVRGWSVIPRLANVVVRLTGLLRSAGSFTELTLSFMPASDADEVELLALAPEGFDFAEASVAAPHEVSERGLGAVRILAELLYGVPLDPPLAIDSVRLPGAGPASFRVTTFRRSVKVDEELSVEGDSTFIVPGRIEVLEQELKPLQALDPAVYPTRSGYMPRIDDVAVAVFRLSFSAPALDGDVLFVQAEPFTFPDGAVCELALPGAADGGDEAGLVPSSVEERGGLLRLRLLSDLAVEVGYTLRVGVHTGNLTDNGERWLFEVHRDATADITGASPMPELPVSTNDGLAEGFALVRKVGLELGVGRVAPRSLADVELIIDPGGSQPTALVLHAPQGYVFPDGTCLPYQVSADAKVLSCRRLVNVENVVELQLTGEGLQRVASVTIVVTAPALQSDAGANEWFAEAIRDEDQVGWGETSGFQVVQMDHAEVMFGGSPTTKAHFAVVFRTSQSLFNGGYIQLRSPEMYKFSCRATDGYSPLSIPDVQYCDDSGNGVTLTLNGTLSPSEYAFVVGVTNPSATPFENYFSVLLSDRNRKVLDARMRFEGPRIVSGLYLWPLELKYSSSTASDEATIEVMLKVHTTLDPLSPLGVLRAIQIAVPDRFTLITRLGVQNPDGLPTPESGWHQLYFAERLVRISLVRHLAEEPPSIKKGNYRLSFVVRLPEFWMPNVNLWLLSLCRDLACTDLISTLPIAGFYLGAEPTLEVSSEPLTTPAEGGGGGARRGARPCGGAGGLAAVAAALVSVACVGATYA